MHLAVKVSAAETAAPSLGLACAVLVKVIVCWLGWQSARTRTWKVNLISALGARVPCHLTTCCGGVPSSGWDHVELCQQRSCATRRTFDVDIFDAIRSNRWIDNERIGQYVAHSGLQRLGAAIVPQANLVRNIVDPFDWFAIGDHASSGFAACHQCRQVPVSATRLRFHRICTSLARCLDAAHDHRASHRQRAVRLVLRST